MEGHEQQHEEFNEQDDLASAASVAIPTEEDLAPPPSRKRGRPPKVDPARSEATKRGHASQALTFDAYVQQPRFDWHQQGMKMQLFRTSPSNWKNVAIGGYIGEKENGFYTQSEIQREYGGGIYEVRVMGPREGHAGTPQIGRKKVRIGGNPKLTHQSNLPAGVAGGSGVPDMSAGAQTELAGVVKQVVGHALGDRAGGGDVDGEAILAGAKMSMDATTRAAEGRARAAEEREQRLVMQMQEMRAEMKQMQMQADARVRDATENNQGLLTSLLPQVSGAAQSQVEHAVRSSADRLAAMERQHAAKVDAMNRQHEMAMQHAQSIHESSSARTEAMFTQQVTLLQQSVQLKDAKIDNLERELQRLRDHIMTLHQEQMKKNNPIARLTENQQLMELMKSTMGGVGGDAEGLGEDAPYWAKMLNSYAPAVSAMAEMAKSKMGIETPGQQQHPPELVAEAAKHNMTPEQFIETVNAQRAQQAREQQAMQQMPRLGQPAAQPQRLPAAQPAQPSLPQDRMPGTAGAAPPPATPSLPRAPQPQAPPVQLKREDLVNAVTLLSGAMVGGTTPSDAANAALNAGDNAMLRELARRNPLSVIKQLAGAKILDDRMNSPQGHQYIVSVLTALKAFFFPAPPPKPVDTPQPTT